MARPRSARQGTSGLEWLKDPTAGWEDDAPTNIEMRNTEVVDHFFRKLLREFLDDLNLEKVCSFNLPLGVVKPWHNAACEQTLRAAQAHFANVRRIWKVYNVCVFARVREGVCARVSV